VIVLDEHLKMQNLRVQILSYYRGRVCLIDELRPSTNIKDDNIPELLIQQNSPTFVTINSRDFWRKTGAHSKYCIICFAIDDLRIGEIPEALRQLFKLQLFRSKAQRMGKIIRISDAGIKYYEKDGIVKTIGKV